MLRLVNIFLSLFRFHFGTRLSNDMTSCMLTQQSSMSIETIPFTTVNKPSIDNIHPKLLDEYIHRKLDLSFDHPLGRSIQRLTCAEYAFDWWGPYWGIPTRDPASGYKIRSDRNIGRGMDISDIQTHPEILTANATNNMICMPSSIFTRNKSWENAPFLKEVIRESIFPYLTQIEVIPKQIIIRRVTDDPMSIYHALNATTSDDNKAIVGKVLILGNDNCQGGYFEFQYKNKTIRFGDLKETQNEDEQLVVNDTIDNRHDHWIAFPIDKLTSMQVSPVTSGEQYLLHCDIITPHVDSPSGLASDPNLLPRGFLNYDTSINDLIQSFTPPPLADEYDDHRRYPKQLPDNIPRVLAELHKSFSTKNTSHCMAIPCFDFYDAKTIKAEHMKDMDRQLLLYILATNEYEVGLTTALIDAEGQPYWDNHFNNVSLYKVHTTGTHPIETAYIGCKQLPTGEMQVFTKPIDKRHPINHAKTTLVTTQKEGHHVVLHRRGFNYDQRWDLCPSIYRYLENIMVICKRQKF